ncbi:sigma-70 family RNA polymerase sigma factor [bacterium]|nr:sigma-70 family RNA polymerase sigma factor [bacterium]
MLKSKGISGNQYSSDDFQEWEVRTATIVIRTFIRNTSYFTQEDENDLLQECLTHWFFKRHKFDETKGVKKETYMSRVINNRLMDLVREKDTAKREIHNNLGSLNKLINEDEDSSELIEFIDKDGLTQIDLDRFELTEFELQIEKVYEKLEPKQIQICEYLKEGYSKVEIAEILKIPRTTLQDEYKRIEKHFMRNGLKSYLK